MAGRGQAHREHKLSLNSEADNWPKADDTLLLISIDPSPCQRPQNHQGEDRKFHDMGWETEAAMFLTGHCYLPGFILKIAPIQQNENGQSLGPSAIGNIPYFQII